MFIQEALKYDDEISVLDPSAEAPCRYISHFTQGDFNEYDSVMAFGKDKDIISVEIEHVHAGALEDLEKLGVEVIPSAGTIRMIQQKTLQKEHYQEHAIPTPAFKNITANESAEYTIPFVQKLNTGGYDGKGVQIIRTEEDRKKLWNEASVLEDLIDIQKELSIIVAKNKDGDTACFPVTEMVADPVLNLLDFNISPAEISPETEKEIFQIAEKFLQSTYSPGLYAIELLLDQNNTVWVNETAPRLHNSGHLTQEGCSVSQFEQFYRVLKNLPLAKPEMKGYSGMLNLVGAEGHQGPVQYEGIEEVMAMPNVYIHLYGKKETKPGRKMGHINVCADTREALISKLSEIKNKVKVISKA